MARFNNGWVKIHRKALLGDIGASYIRSGLFGTLVAIANLKESTAVWNGKPRKIHRGEIVTSLKELAELGDIDEKTVNRHLNYLVLRETIIVEKSRTGTFIKFLNFEQYQSKDAEGSAHGPFGVDDNMEDDVRSSGIHIEEGKNKRRKELKNTSVFFAEKFERAWTEYKNLPDVVKGQKAEARFSQQIKNDLDFDQLIMAITNYRQMLAQPAHLYRKPKTSFETFLGTKSSGFFWRDYIEWRPSAPNSIETPLNPDYFDKEA